MTLALALIGVGISSHEHLHELLAVNIEHHAVDGLELQRVVVVVDHFHQCVAGRQCQILLGGLANLLLLVAGLGSSEGVVAIAHGEQQRCYAADTILLLHGTVGSETFQRIGNGIDLLCGQLVATDVTAVLHQLEVIDLLHACSGGSERLNDSALGVIDQQHHVGQLNGSIAAHLGAGRNTIQHRALSGADQRAGAGSEIIGIQIHHTDEAMTDTAVGLLTLHIEEAVAQRLENALVHILLHGGVDVADNALHIGIFQLCLGENEAQRGGGVAHLLLHRLPIFRLGGKLIASHHGPLMHILSLGHQDVGGIKAQLLKLLVHGVSSLFPSM